jgi:hypothetical protein
MNPTVLHYLPLGDESSPRGRWSICGPALPEVLTLELSNRSSSYSILHIPTLISRLWIKEIWSFNDLFHGTITIRNS